MTDDLRTQIVNALRKHQYEAMMYGADGSYESFADEVLALPGFANTKSTSLRSDRAATESHRKKRRMPTPLTVTRDPEKFAAWWANTADAEKIAEQIEAVAAADYDLEHDLHSLILDIFQAPAPVNWLHVAGLRPGVEIRYMMFDIEPAHDTDGTLNGVDVNWIMYPVDVNSGCLHVRVWVDKPSRVFGVTPGTEPSAAVAQIIDTALAILNQEIADQDKFNTVARAKADR